MPDFYKRMFTLDAGTTYTILGSAGTGSAAGKTLESCTAIVADSSTSVSLKFPGEDAWQTGVTLIAGEIYPYKLVGVRPTARIRGLN
jgi:hypothetical protein